MAALCTPNDNAGCLDGKDLRLAFSYVDGLLERGLLFSSPMHEATEGLTAQIVSGYGDNLARMRRFFEDHIDELEERFQITEDATTFHYYERESAFLLGLAAGLRIAGGGR